MTIRQQTRRSLNNDRFEQLSGDTLNLSGNTNIIGTLTIPQNAGLGKVLISDLSGNTRWGDPILGDSIRKTINQNLHGFSILNVVGFSGSTYNKPIANGTYDGEIIGLVNRVVDVNNFEVTFAGHITSLTGLTQNTTYFLSPNVAGELTSVEPTADGHISKSILFADTTTSGWVLPYPGHIVTSGETVLNLGIIPTGINNIITNSGGGTDAILSGATTTLAGLVTTSTQSFSGSKSFIIPSGHTDGFNVIETSIPQRVFTINTLNRFLSIDSNNIGYNVGIGTSLPSTKLNVIGNVHLTGGLGVGVLNPIAGTIQTSGNVNVGGGVVTTFRNGYFIGSRLMVSDFSWGGDNNNVWLGGAINNTVTGATALEGNANIAIGVNALSVLTSGSSNIAIGVNALRINTASHNIAIGRNALFNNTSGSPNIAIGSGALSTNSGGFQNVAVGDSALRLNTAGFRNNAFGHNALGNNTTGEANNAFGYMALFNNITGIRNSAFGEGTLGSNSTGSQNSVFGSGSMVANTSGRSNVAVGMNTLVNNTIGNANIAIGTFAGGGIINGSSNVIIGTDIGGLASGLTNNIILGSGSIIRMQFDGTNWTFQGNMGLGVSPTARLDVDGQIRIRGGGPAAGHVLTSNADGLATWQAPTGGGSGNVIGSGTTNTIIKFTGINTIGDSTISDVEGNVIINGSLQITGNTSIGNVLNILNPAHTFNYSIMGGAITANRVLNIPAIAGNDTFMTLNTNQIVLGNKIFNPGMFSLNNPSSTFQYSIQTSAIVTNRNVILPLLNDDDIFVFENHIQTLTNKTINISSNVIIDTSQAVGDLLRNNGTRVVRFARGTAGQVLRTNLAGTDIEWADGGGTFPSAGIALSTGTAWGTSIVNNSANWNTAFGWGNHAGLYLPLGGGTLSGNLIVGGHGRFNQIQINNPALTFQYIFTSSAIVANRNITLPLLTADDTFVFTNNVATLTNKTINAANNTIIGLEPSITAGTTAQYFRGDKTWQTLNSTIVAEGTNLYFTDARARAAISLTTIGTSGAATYVGGVLNIPNYAVGGVTWPLLSAIDGTAAAPAYSWASNPNMGIRRGGVNDLRIVVGGSDLMRFTITEIVVSHHISFSGLISGTIQATQTNEILLAGRNVLTGAGLTGGGDLTADRTLSLTGQALAIHNLATNGIIARTAANTFASRTITGTANQIIVTDGGGIAGNPVLSLPQNIHTGANPTFAGGTFNGDVLISGISIDTPLVITSTPAANRSNISFGNSGNASAGLPSARMTFRGDAIEHAGFVWIPNGMLSEGRLNLSFGGFQDPNANIMRVTFRANGDVGIGVNPTTRLDVDGQIRIRGGSPAAGRVLTSDVNGLATWQAPSVGTSLPLTEAPATNLTGTGISVVMTAGETISIGQLVYFRSDGRVWLSDADLSNAYPAIGIALSAGVAAGAITILTHGIIRNDAWAWTVGGVVYMSTVAGGMSQTPPTGSGTRVQVIGVATHADRVFINPSLNLIELI